MNIRKARLKDLDFLCESFLKTTIFEKNLSDKINLKGVKSIEFKSDVAKEILLPDYLYLILELNGEKVGFINGCIKTKSLWWNYKKISYIDHIFVDEKYRNMGYGKKLLAEFENWASKKGSDFITIELIPENKKALNLYKKLGFEDHLLHLGKKIKKVSYNNNKNE